jgi:uncharacterized membrane protein
MICSYCDAPMPEVSAFCPACGRSVDEETPDSAELRERLLAALAYVALFPAVAFLIIPATRGSRFIRFHSWQSVLFLALSLLLALALRLSFVIFSLLPVVGFLLAWLLLGVGSLGLVTVWVVLVVKAILGHSFELPYIGPAAVRLTNRRLAHADSSGLS